VSEVRIIGKVRFDQLAVEVDLAVGHQDGKLGRKKAFVGSLAICDLLV
jgi:hypothetical protein